MNLADPVTSGWHARLALGFSRREAATILAQREHTGPLRVQKPLYPEGETVCHAIILHPPSGVAGGDELEIDTSVERGAHALLTTPGAGKWYRSGGAWAAQHLHFDVAEGGALEWLPQETIVFNGALAGMNTNIDLAVEARFIGWEVLCLGRRACGEGFESGALRLETRIRLGGRPIWLERGQLEGGDALLNSPVGLAGFSVCGTLLAVGPGVGPDLLAACRKITALEGGARHGLTQLPEILAARYLGHSSEAARHWFAALWQVLRPALMGRQAQAPRIWNT
jgi:urease accessory protein